jgi:hypothetical protein
MTEPLLLSTPVGLKDLGSDFDPNAPFTGCRICGDLFQHAEDRTCKDKLDEGIITERKLLDGSSYFIGPQLYMDMIDHCTRRRKLWVKRHSRQKHNDLEILRFVKHASKTGQAFTAEAAHKLAPFGITPLISGVEQEDIVDALAKAPRAPNIAEESGR